MTDEKEKCARRGLLVEGSEEPLDLARRDLSQLPFELLLVHGRELPDVATSRVRFVELSEAEISWYIGTGEPEGKAGAYAIQGLGSRYVDWIEGSWSNVVGLPVPELLGLAPGLLYP